MGVSVLPLLTKSKGPVTDGGAPLDTTLDCNLRVRSGLTRRTCARCRSRAGTLALYMLRGNLSSWSAQGREAYILEF